MDKYIFSVEAISSMLNECFKSGNNETGGIYVSHNSCKNVITDVVPSSSFAERGAATYFQSERDVSLLNTKLREFQLKNYDFRGYWHRHPAFLKTLSQGDLNTCFSILQNSSYKVGNKLLMSIITETKDNEMPIFSYVVSLDETNRVVVRNIDITILPMDCIKKFVECFESKPAGTIRKELCNENKDNGIRRYYQKTGINRAV